MSQEITITSITAYTPVDIYYCDSMSANCQFVTTATTFPVSFIVDSPFDEQDFVIKIIDSESCQTIEMVYVTPTPTPSVTPTGTMTPTPTQTNTQTPTSTPTNTPTNTQTPTNTVTNTPTPTTTPVVASHIIGKLTYLTSAQACESLLSSTYYYTYINESYLVPIIGAKVYQTNANSVLYNVYNGNNRYIKMGFGFDYYAVKINVVGEITDFTICM